MFNFDEDYKKNVEFCIIVYRKKEKWEKDLEKFWKKYTLSDFDEYLDLRKAEFFEEQLFERNM